MMNNIESLNTNDDTFITNTITHNDNHDLIQNITLNQEQEIQDQEQTNIL